MSLSIREIEQSLQNSSSIKDPVISQGTPLIARKKQLQKYSGGFAVVFPFDVNGTKWAFRCVYADLGNMEPRLKTLSDGLNRLRLTYFEPFTYESRGLEIDGKLYPTTRMKWVEGDTIKDFICENKDKPEILLKLADDFMTMCTTLHKHKIAHGDLQHENILVDKKGKLVLIDYDSVYIPELQGENDIIHGLPAYQHPLRAGNKQANEKLDYFSELIIYLSIVAIAEDANLVRKYKIKDAENLLFCADDYKDIENSQIFSDIQKLSEKPRLLLSILQDYLKKNSILELEPFEVLLARMSVSLTLSKEKIRKGKEKAQLFWKVISADKIVLYADGQELQECNRQGAIEVAPDADTEYRIKVYYSNQLKPEERKVKLLVRPEAVVEFFADKEYTLPTVPIKLSWNVKNALKVVYNGKTKSPCDSVKIVEGIEKETEFEISVTDEFETKTYSTKVSMLPLPVIETLLVPTPEIEDSINVVATMPIQLKDTQLITVNPPTVVLPDIEQLSEQMPPITEMPILEAPQFELPESFYKKIDEKMKGLISSIQNILQEKKNKFIKK